MLYSAGSLRSPAPPQNISPRSMPGNVIDIVTLNVIFIICLLLTSLSSSVVRCYIIWIFWKFQLKVCVALESWLLASVALTLTCVGAAFVDWTFSSYRASYKLPTFIYLFVKLFIYFIILLTSYWHTDMVLYTVDFLSFCFLNWTYCNYSLISLHSY